MRSHKVTEAQKQQWAIDGYLVLKGALSRPERQKITRQVDRLHRKLVARNPDAKVGRGLNRRNALSDSDVFIDLIDHPAVFDVVLGLMGPYIQLSMAQVLVRPPNPDYSGYIHADGGPAMSRMRVTETSLPLQIKIQYFLTDVARPDSGNFTLFPGSHLRPFPADNGRISPNAPGAVQLCVKAGDAALFSHSLWHGVAPNRSGRSRKSLIYCYSQMCFRPFDFYTQPPEILERCTPRQQRLLGDLGDKARPGGYFYSPKDQVELMEGKKRGRRKVRG